MTEMTTNETPCPVCGARREELAPADHYDPVIEAYKKDVDRTLLRENLKLTVEERVLKAQSFHASIERWRGAAAKPPQPQPAGGDGA